MPPQKLDVGAEDGKRPAPCPGVFARDLFTGEAAREGEEEEEDDVPPSPAVADDDDDDAG